MMPIQNFCNKIFTKRIAQLIGFYFVFYSCLGAIFAFYLSIYLSTLDYNVPRFYGKDSIIGDNPGVGFQPWLKEDPEPNLIRFNPNKNSTYERYVSVLRDYLLKYKNTSNTRNCFNVGSNSEIVRGGKWTTKPACRFDLKVFESECNETKFFGYTEGKPCVLLSVNRMIGWVPEQLDVNDIPEEIQGRYKKNFIAFNCYAVSDIDKETIGDIKYIPMAGIDFRFYPYAVMPNYHQPIIMVKFISLPKNSLFEVECKAYAKNIVHDTIKQLGLVRFKIFVHDPD